jgi:tRNA threonylcarbamoyl adenosine modification protein YeaZ
MSEPGAVGPVVLVMDGSSRVSSAALLLPIADGWQLLTRRADPDSRGQARVLLRLVDDMLRETGRGPGDIGGVVVGTGPGTFTGVRVTVATARGLALALAVPVVGVPTLSALAAEAVAAAGRGGALLPGLVVPVVDARRGQLFYGVYRLASPGRYVRSEPFAVCDRQEMFERVRELRARGTEEDERETVIAGETEHLPESAMGAHKAPVLLALQVRAEYLLSGQGRLQEPGEADGGAELARWVSQAVGSGNRGPNAYPAGELGSPEGVKPVYVRSPDADIHITKMRDPWAVPGRGA